MSSYRIQFRTDRDREQLLVQAEQVQLVFVSALNSMRAQPGLTWTDECARLTEKRRHSAFLRRGSSHLQRQAVFDAYSWLREHGIDAPSPREDDTCVRIVVTQGATRRIDDELLEIQIPKVGRLLVSAPAPVGDASRAYVIERHRNDWEVEFLTHRTNQPARTKPARSITATDDHRPGRYVSKSRAGFRRMYVDYARKCGPVTSRAMTPEERARWSLDQPKETA